MKYLLLAILIAVAGCPSTKNHQGTRKYPLDTCIVTDNDLQSMGGPITRIYNGQEIKVCCKPCFKKFYKNPDKYLAKLK